MRITSGDVKVDSISPDTWSYLASPPMRIHKVFFSIRGTPGYSVELPVEGFSAPQVEAAILAKAQAICDSLDLFK